MTCLERRCRVPTRLEGITGRHRARGALYTAHAKRRRKTLGKAHISRPPTTWGSPMAASSFLSSGRSRSPQHLTAVAEARAVRLPRGRCRCSCVPRSSSRSHTPRAAPTAALRHCSVEKVSGGSVSLGVGPLQGCSRRGARGSRRRCRAPTRWARRGRVATRGEAGRGREPPRRVEVGRRSACSCTQHGRAIAA